MFRGILSTRQFLAVLIGSLLLVASVSSVSVCPRFSVSWLLRCALVAWAASPLFSFGLFFGGHCSPQVSEYVFLVMSYDVWCSGGSAAVLASVRKGRFLGNLLEFWDF